MAARKQPRTRRLLAAFALLAALLAACVGAVVWADGARDARDARLEDAAFYDGVVESEQRYLLECQSGNGALLYTPVRDGEARVVPYFSSIGVLGLLEGGPAETRPDRLAAVEGYLSWYGSHLEDGSNDGMPAGSIADYDYVLASGAAVDESASSPDSVDSYAATYVLAMAAYCEAGGDVAFATEREDDARQVVEALLSTLGPRGLSSVSPSNGTSYLMDNVEVLAALRAVPRLVDRVWGSPESGADGGQWADIARQCEDAASTLETALEAELWDEDAQRWRVGVDSSSGEGIDWKGWTDFYPSAVAQIAPAAWDDLPSAAASDRDEALYEAFCEAWEWERFEHVDSGAASFCWSMTAYVAAKLGDEERARAYLEEYVERTGENDHGWPLYVADAAWASRAAALLADAARDDARGMDPFGLLELIP